METSLMADSALVTLLLLERTGARSTAEVAAELALSRNSARRILDTLHGRGFVVRDAAQRFRLGPTLISIAAELPSELAIAADPHVTDLAERLGETVVLAMLEGEHSVIVTQSLGVTSPLRVEHEIGFRQPLSRGASSLAILAHLPGDDDRVARSGVAATELAAIRARGYALSVGHIRTGMIGIAAPLYRETARVAGSLAVIAPETRAQDLTRHAELLRSTADLIRNAYRSLRETSRIAEESPR
ncbi:IclR family transcriptional regulator [Leucobacter sp. 7(1)]|uniref:IclR family transcriptional regulator n=1 Tax=Leucobacter sp. 7(1) TaxID=1255613 RepID=UPI00111E865E|nr:IclR family transcriptional regulator C-terminal domain-containing protein [Leucobacter sp. 7(1)]